MASDLNFVEYICDQIKAAGHISSRKMFGEYAIYHGEKVVALVCDNQLFVKPTAVGRAMLSEVVEAPPYPGAKPCFVIEEQLEDAQWMTDFIRSTASELPMPRPKKPKTKVKDKKQEIKKK